MLQEIDAGSKQTMKNLYGLWYKPKGKDEAMASQANQKVHKNIVLDPFWYSVFIEFDAPVHQQSK